MVQVEKIKLMKKWILAILYNIFEDIQYVFFDNALTNQKKASKNLLF